MLKRERVREENKGREREGKRKKEGVSQEEVVENKLSFQNTPGISYLKPLSSTNSENEN